MFVWFLTLSVLGVFLVFRDADLDYRLVAFGAILPDLIDGIAFRGLGPLHSVTAAVGFLGLVMLATKRGSGRRKRLLAVPIGVFAHLVLDGAWANTVGFWWPFAGRHLSGPIPSFDRSIAVLLIQEGLGLVAGGYLYKRFGLRHQKLRQKFLSTGNVDKRVV
jgi:membrane-bound metal-dependent hydrolase YbcI (DUF457 family)